MRNIYLILSYTLSVLAIILVSCGRVGEDIEVWAEGALAVLGGTIMATQNEGLIASLHPKVMETPWDLLSPNAWAAEECPTLLQGTCDDRDMTLEYARCRSSSVKKNGFRKGTYVIRFPSNAHCLIAASEGFSSTMITSMVGTNLSRLVGGVSEESDQNNVRITDSKELAMNYTVFATGWKEPKSGGVSVFFDSTTQRRIVISGVQMINNVEDFTPSDEAPLDLGENTPLDEVPLPFQYRLRIPWNHTINTPTAGELLFEYGAALTFDDDLNPTFGGIESQVLSPRDGDAIIEGNTVQKGAIFKVQYNISSSVGVHVVTEPLVYGDPLCCWPTQGTMRSQFDLNYKVPALWEEIVFLDTDCGAIQYTSSEGEKNRDRLNHCF